MTENEAYHAVGLLIGGVSMWPEAATDGFVAAFVKHVVDVDAMIEVCEAIALSWKDRPGHPTTGEVLDAYRRHPSVAADREMRTAEALARTTTTHCKGSGWIDEPLEPGRMKPCPRCNPYLSDVFADLPRRSQYRDGTALPDLHEAVTVSGRGGEMRVEVAMPPSCKVDTRYDPERHVDFAEGAAIIGDEYRSVYGREIGSDVVANPVYAAMIITDQGSYDVGRDVWHSTYGTVLAAFSGDHPRTAASLKALGRRLTWDDRGKLALKRPPELPPERPEPSYTPPAPPDTPEPSDSLQDASTLMRQAIGDTATRITDDD